MKTTLNKIRKHHPCPYGWKTLLSNLDKTSADDEPLAITTILDSNGLDDALWCLRAVDGHHCEIRLYAVGCARSVQYLMKNPVCENALEVAEGYANGLVSEGTLESTRNEVTKACHASIKESSWAALVARASVRDALLCDTFEAARLTSWRAYLAYEIKYKPSLAMRVAHADFLRLICAEIEQRDDLWW